MANDRTAGRKRPARIGWMAAALACAAGAASAQSFEDIRADCVGCHGENGQSEMAQTPSLGGLDDYYALISLVAFREGNRPSEIMQAQMDGLPDQTLRDAAAWIAGLPEPLPPREALPPAEMERGQNLAHEHRCDRCHGADLRGGHQMPPIRNQRADYLEKALHDYRAERRFGDRAAMVEVAQGLSGEDISTLARYLSHMPAH